MRYKASPFQVSLVDTGAGCPQNLSAGVKVKVTAQTSHWFLHAWGCDIPSFHENVVNDWRCLRQELRDGSLFSNKVLWKSEPELCFETEREVLLKPSIPITPQAIGKSSRNRFPLVIFMIVNEEDESQLKPSDSVRTKENWCWINVYSIFRSCW